jgi:hypothetical protein
MGIAITLISIGMVFLVFVAVSAVGDRVSEEGIRRDKLPLSEALSDAPNPVYYLLSRGVSKHRLAICSMCIASIALGFFLVLLLK